MIRTSAAALINQSIVCFEFILYSPALFFSKVGVQIAPVGKDYGNEEIHLKRSWGILMECFF